MSGHTQISPCCERRILYYNTTDHRLFAFNVDTRTNTENNVGGKFWGIASLTGIDCGVKAVFYCYDGCTYTLNMDDTVTKVGEGQNGSLKALFPSISNPKSVKDGVFMYYDYHGDRSYLVKDGKKIDVSPLIKSTDDSTIRVYKDIFLTYDKNTESWVLVRILVP